MNNKIKTKQIYWVWAEMIQRCENHNNKHFHLYGGRGIKVCDSWRKSFNTFLNDMGERPSGYTLERIDNSLGYSKENCCWADRTTQSLNRRLFKNNQTKIKGVEYREKSGYRVRVRRKGEIVLNKTVQDFFEACCIRKAFDLQEMANA